MLRVRAGGLAVDKLKTMPALLIGAAHAGAHPIEASLSSRLSQASSRLTQSFEAKLKGLKPHAGPEDLELEARAGTEAIYTRPRSPVDSQ